MTPLDIEDSRVRLRNGLLQLQPVARVPIANASAAGLIERFISRDIPFVLTGLLKEPVADDLANLADLAATVRRTDPRSRESRNRLSEIVSARWPLVATDARTPVVTSIAAHWRGGHASPAGG